MRRLRDVADRRQQWRSRHNVGWLMVKQARLQVWGRQRAVAMLLDWARVAAGAVPT